MRSTRCRDPVMRIRNVYNQYPQWSRKVSYEMKITRVFQNENFDSIS